MTLLAASLLPSLMFAAGCALLTAILLRRTYKQLARSGRQRSSDPIARQPRPANEWSGAYSDASALIERQKVELHDQGRELKAQLDNKVVVLQELIAQSQRQIERLEALLKDAGRA